MNRPKWLAIGILVGVFVFGMVAGGGVVAAWHGHQRRDEARLGLWQRGERPLVALVRRLELSREQRESIEDLLERHAPRRRAIMQEIIGRCGQELEQEKARLDSEIRAILTPAQRDRFDELSARQRERLFGPPGSRPRGD